MLDAVIIVQIWCYSILLLSFKERTEFSYEDSKKNEKENFKEIKENGHTIRGLYHLVVSGKVISFVISPNAQCPIQTSSPGRCNKNNGLHGLRVVWKSGGLTVEQI